MVLINAARLTLRSSPGGLNNYPNYVLHLSNKEMYVFKVHAISKISRWPCGPNQCRCFNPASFPAGQYANPDFPSSPLQQRMYVLKVHRISEILNPASCPGGQMFDPDFLLHPYNSEGYMCSKSTEWSKNFRCPCGPNQCQSLIPASCRARQMLTLICLSSSATMRYYTLYIFTIRQRDW